MDGLGTRPYTICGFNPSAPPLLSGRDLPFCWQATTRTRRRSLWRCYSIGKPRLDINRSTLGFSYFTKSTTSITIQNRITFKNFWRLFISNYNVGYLGKCCSHPLKNILLSKKWNSDGFVNSLTLTRGFYL